MYVPQLRSKEGLNLALDKLRLSQNGEFRVWATGLVGLHADPRTLSGASGHPRDHCPNLDYS